MHLRLLAALGLLLLAGCATTGTEPASLPDGAAVPVRHAPAKPAVAVDEHLFNPDRIDSGDHYGNVWERVIDQFALPDCAAHEANLQWARWYADRPDYMARVFNRAQPWIYYIAGELEKRNMPGELALLPIVESAYDPFAFSSGRALGTWQFISETGKRYGLNQNWWYDGRRDVWASTVAALEYLNTMARLFDGDWLLALAGYNAGENRILREVQRNQSAGRPVDFWNLSLPRETRGYVPKLLGLACLFKNAADYQFVLAHTPNEPVVAAVEMDQQADLVLLSQISGVPVDVLFTLNPGYNRWATAPEGPFRVVLPVENAATLQAALETAGSELMKWDQVVVERGDTLSLLASRHQVPVDVLRHTNDLHGDTIHPGQRLRLPRDDQLMIDPMYAAAASELQQLQAGLIAADRVTHNVRPGENLSTIARRYKVSVEDLQRWNGISDPRKLRAGRQLVVFHTPTQTPTIVGSGGSTIKHVVQRGDSLWSIARKYKVKINELRSWNDLNSGSTLHPGQSIQIQL